MPHKHRRDKTADKALYELPPTTLARPLPVVNKPHPPPSKLRVSTTTRSLKRKRQQKDATDDDTPRSFARLMAFHTKGIKPRSGLDDGHVLTKKRKRAADDAGQVSDRKIQKPEAPSAPQIKAGERMSDFAARVDAAIPVSGLVGKGTRGVKSIPGIKLPQTRTEKKWQKMQKEWREAEARRKEKLEAEREETEAEGDARVTVLPIKKGKRRRNSDDDNDDPWAEIAKARANQTSNSSGLIGLHDVVQAPPQFSGRPPRDKFGLRNGAKVQISDVPGKAGSVRRREELGQARMEVVERYRAMMKGRKDGVVGST